MALTLPPQIKSMIRQKIDSGRYADEIEVVHAARNLLDERDKYAHLRDDLARAEEQIARDEGVPYTPEQREENRREARRKLRDGLTPNPDVVPYLSQGIDDNHRRVKRRRTPSPSHP